MCAVLCCAARRVVWFRLRLRCCWCLVLWRVPVCCGVSLGVLRCGGAALVCCGVPLCCALSCGVLRPVLCRAVLCCLAVLCWWAVLCGCPRCWCLFFLLSSFPLLNTPAVSPSPCILSENQKFKRFSLENQTLRNSRTQASSNTKVKFLTYVLPRGREDGGLACKGLTAFPPGPVA